MYWPENHPPGFKGDGLTGCIPARDGISPLQEKKPIPQERVRKYPERPVCKCEAAAEIFRRHIHLREIAPPCDSDAEGGA